MASQRDGSDSFPSRRNSFPAHPLRDRREQPQRRQQVLCISTLSFDSVVLCVHFVYIFPHEHHRLATEELLAIEAPEALAGPVPDARETMLDVDDTVHGSRNLR